MTATPARHGPAGIEPLSGDVIGFALTFKNGQTRPIYITGDTVWYDGVAEGITVAGPSFRDRGARNSEFKR